MKKKFNLRNFLRTISLVLVCIYLILRILGLLDNRLHWNTPDSWYKAYAVDTPEVMLTYEQTVALYGSSFDVTYYNSKIDATYTRTAHLTRYTSEDFIPSDYTDSSYVYFSGFSNGTNETREGQLLSQRYLVYQIDFDSREGSADDSFVSYNGDAHANIGINFPISLNSISRFRHNILWSARTKSGTGNEYQSNSGSTNSFALYNTSFDSVLRVNAGGYRDSYCYASWPLYRRASLTDPLDESLINYQHFIIGDVSAPTSGDLFSLSGINYTLNHCGVINYDLSHILNDWTMYILIGCPIISGYVPTTTTQPAATTRPKYTGEYGVTTGAYTYDLSPLETNQINQINIANENLNYVAGIFDGVNIIIQQLDDIYNAMVARGEIAVDLFPASTLPRSTDIEDYMAAHLGSYTTAQMPPAAVWKGASDIGDLIDIFGDRFTWFFAMGIMSLSLSLLSWAIFKGRGG